MRKFLSQTGLFILPILICIVILEILLRAMPNSYKVKKNYLDHHADEIKTLILGSSHTYNGLNPEYFKEGTFNAANNAQFLDYDFELFNAYKDDLENLETIIIPISYFSLFGTQENAFEPWRVKNYNIYYKLKINHSLAYNSEVLSNRFDHNIRRLIRYYIKGDSDSSSDTLGWNVRYKNHDPADPNFEKDAERITSVQNAFKNYDMDLVMHYVNVNRDILNKFITWANQNNARILFVTLPTYESFNRHLDPKQMDFIAETMAEIQQESSNVFYYDLQFDTDFTMEDFEDSHHLNASGATKTSIKVNAFLEKLSRNDAISNKK